MSKDNIRPITMEHIQRYGDIYAKAFSGEPWNDPWKTEDAVIHVRELLESKQAYGLEYVLDGKVVGFILGTSMLEFFIAKLILWHSSYFNGVDAVAPGSYKIVIVSVPIITSAPSITHPVSLSARCTSYHL